MRVVRLALLLAALVSPLAARAGDVVVRTKREPADAVVVGQPVRLFVDVLFPDTMPRPPRVSIGDAPGVQVMRFETQAVTMQDRIDGQAYVGQRFEFVAFPRRGGTLAVPAPEVTLLDAAGDATGTAHGAPLDIVATVPPGIDASGPVLATNTLNVTQSWRPEPATSSFKPGGAIVRTVHRRAAGLPALGIADFAYTAPAGVRVYVDAPQADDRVDRGEVTGERTDTVTYVFETPGRFDLPALVQPWWDLDDRTARKETLPGTAVEVAAAASTASPAGGASWRSVGAAALLALAALVAWPLVRRTATWWRARRRAQEASAAAAFAALQRAASGGDAAATYHALEVWLARLSPSAREKVRADAAIAPSIGQLERHLFGADGAWGKDEGVALSRKLGLIDVHSARPRTECVVLPPLNPPLPG